jgi:serine/threonine protein kinase
VNPTVDDADLPEIGAAERLLASARAEPPGVGEYVGNYELVEEVGRGAQSVVYRARQQEPVRREVALKVLYDPADGGNMRARFFRERALLARVSHHGLAQLLDCGETAPTEARAALPWFAMPFIEGEPIDRWCMRHGATRAVKLVLLERVADAVGAAHAVGVIHRDIKPSNILVAGSPADPRVIVIDFGIAKVLEGDATPVGVSESGALRGSDAIATRHGAVVGTPEFMSPEQADLDAASVGAASDVYAIGLIAYLLFGGSVPGFESTSSSVLKSTAEPRSLGARLRAASGREVPPISRITRDRALRGEVEWIVAKCCARDRSARYADARALAEDLRRLRERQPISAAPADSAYPLWFVLRKHKWPLAMTMFALVVFMAVLVIIATGEKARADREADQRTKLAETLARVRATLVPITGRGRGDVVNESEAVPILESLHALNVALLGSTAPESQQAALSLARAYDRVRRYTDAEQLYRSLLADVEQDYTRPGDQAFLRFSLGGNLRRQGGARLLEARSLLLQALQYWDVADPSRSARCACTLELAFVAGADLQLLERSDWITKGIECLERYAPQGSMRTREAYGFMADHLREAGDYAAAHSWYEKALDGLVASDASEQIWADVWKIELLWLTMEEARIRAAPIQTELQDELDRRIRAFQERNLDVSSDRKRLERWAAHTGATQK